MEAKEHIALDQQTVGPVISLALRRWLETVVDTDVMPKVELVGPMSVTVEETVVRLLTSIPVVMVRVVVEVLVGTVVMEDLLIIDIPTRVVVAEVVVVM